MITNPRFITIMRATTAKNDLFEDVNTFTEYLRIGCTLSQPTSARQFQESNSDTTASLNNDIIEATIYYSDMTSTITIRDRAVLNGINYEIVSVDYGDFDRRTITLVLRRSR